MRIATDMNANMVLSPSKTESSASRSETRASVALRRVASQAPSAISHTADPDAPKNTDAVIARGRLSLGRHRK
jgi:hypothetical protein